MIIGRGGHALASPVHIVGLVAVKHPHHRQELAHRDEQSSVLALDNIGLLKIGRNQEGFLDVRRIDIGHALAHDIHSLSLEVIEHPLGCDKRGAVIVEDDNVHSTANLTMRLGTKRSTYVYGSRKTVDTS